MFNDAMTKKAMLLAVVLMAGCASNVRLDEAPVETRTPGAPQGGTTTPAPGSGSGAGGTSGAVTPPPPESRVATVDAARRAADAANAAGRVVYFDFDSFIVKDDFKPLIEAHARALVANSGKRMVIEGHTDERGGREYNLALGQKRADAVVRSLALLGVADNRLEAVSFGEERPAVTGSDEAAWAKNRRAELKDR